MKRSHFASPRTMRDGDWSAWADPIERFDSADAGHAVAAFVAVVLFVVLLAWIVITWGTP